MDNTPQVIAGLLAAHWVGDFLLQSDYMALNKSKDNIALANHCTAYSLVMAAITTIIYPGSD